MKSLKALSVALASVLAYSAPASAYWTEILVCPKKKVTVNHIAYQCTYSGTLLSTINHSDSIHTSIGQYVNGRNCSSQTFIGNHYERGVSYSGYLSLTGITDLSYTEVKWVDDPANCELKTVWVDDMDKECIRNNNCPGD
ncbi:hypothetical protein [Pseudoalteromonas rubra]|uniref:Uncharacterized protein n=1 Tax=Pseudoalteromonas rubra TaxID=43658 RepID=A0A5S3WZU5_9GAMM|nr:hypothetical protein [Pseudoalteromonas rubra]TMP37438.1 hypothetical protein CWB98_09660 [Pseudoalteromonas rubra]